MAILRKKMKKVIEEVGVNEPDINIPEELTRLDIIETIDKDVVNEKLRQGYEIIETKSPCFGRDSKLYVLKKKE